MLLPVESSRTVPRLSLSVRPIIPHANTATIAAALNPALRKRLRRRDRYNPSSGSNGMTRLHASLPLLHKQGDKKFLHEGTETNIRHAALKKSSAHLDNNR